MAKTLTVQFKTGGELVLILNDRMDETEVKEALAGARSPILEKPTILVWTVKGGSNTSKMQVSPRAPEELVGVVKLVRTMTNVFVARVATFLWPTVKPDALQERLQGLVRSVIARSVSAEHRFVFGYQGSNLVLANCADLVLPEPIKPVKALVKPRRTPQKPTKGKRSRAL